MNLRKGKWGLHKREEEKNRCSIEAQAGASEKQSMLVNTDCQLEKS